MSLVNDIDTLCDWLRENVCRKVRLKRPVEGDLRDAEKYEYELVHPAVHGMFTPTSATMCPDGCGWRHPSITVQLTGSTESAGMRDISATLYLTSWSPGEHGRDTWLPRSDGGYTREESDSFSAKADSAWRDAWNFADACLRELREADGIGDALAIDRTKPIECAPLSDDGAVIDTYPYCMTCVSLHLVESVPERTSLAQYL